ncbi:MAG: hypothetical protein AAF692_12010, partial [Pseudomonadota bacterium]
RTSGLSFWYLVMVRAIIGDICGKQVTIRSPATDAPRPGMRGFGLGRAHRDLLAANVTIDGAHHH